jgi:hypothetical protein
MFRVAKSHGRRRRTRKNFWRPLPVGAGHRYPKQLSTLRATNLDGPAPPSAVRLNAQLEGDKLCQLKRSLSHGKFTHPNMRLEALRADKGETVSGNGKLGADHLKNIPINDIFTFSYANN